MKNGIKIVAALTMAFTGILGTAVMVSHAGATAVIVDCGCGKRTCDGGCRLRRAKSTCCEACNTDCGCVQCPSCEDDICRLELDNRPVKKTCFKVEQKVVCIPAVRLPWKKDCPPATSKTRTVNTLKKHSYECPNCTYKWTVQKPEAPTGASIVQTTMTDVSQSTSQYAPTPIAAPQSAQPWVPAPQIIRNPVVANQR